MADGLAASIADCFHEPVHRGVLDGSGSTRGSGTCQYLYTVIPGRGKATVDFVNGPGLHLLQLIVTDASGNRAKSPVIAQAGLVCRREHAWYTRIATLCSQHFYCS